MHKSHLDSLIGGGLLFTLDEEEDVVRPGSRLWQECSTSFKWSIMVVMTEQKEEASTTHYVREKELQNGHD